MGIFLISLNIKEYHKTNIRAVPNINQVLINRLQEWLRVNVGQIRVKDKMG